MKASQRGKSRLGAAGARRARLARAFHADTVAALLASSAVAGVLVVTDDPDDPDYLRDLGATVHRQSGRGLNPALVEGLAVAGGARPGAPLAVVLGDLPALRSESIDIALAVAAASPRAVVVADAAGTGTTMLADVRGQPDPAFGIGSRSAHAAGGAIDITARVPADLRRDVDTEDDLLAALGLGVGPATAAALRARGDEDERVDTP